MKITERGKIVNVSSFLESLNKVIEKREKRIDIALASQILIRLQYLLSNPNFHDGSPIAQYTVYHAALKLGLHPKIDKKQQKEFEIFSALRNENED